MEKIVEYFCTEEIMRNRLACLTKEQTEFLRKACVMPQDVSVIEIVDGMQLYNYWIECFEETTVRVALERNTKNAVVKISNHSVRAKSQLPLAC